VAKRTGKTHENLEKHLENEVTPPPTTTPRSRSAGGRHARGDRSGPIGISGGDFATPTARKRTITQPRGLPVVGAPARADARSDTNGTPTPAPRNDGAQPEAPFAAPGDEERVDAASLAAEAAAVRALDSGPLTPPPTVDDPGPTPPPSATDAPAPVVDEAPPVAAEAEAPPADSEPPPVDSEPSPAADAPVAAAEMSAAFESLTSDDGPEPEPTVDRFDAQETPWPELGAHTASPRASTPIPGAIPTDAMGGDSGGDKDMAFDSSADIAGGDELELDEGAELPAEAFADSGPLPANDLAPAPPPAPRTPPAPPPIPSAPRRKTGEIRPTEVPTAQVVASLVPDLPSGGGPALPEALAPRPRRPKRSKPWFEEVFDEDYLRTLPFMSADQTLREVEFIEASLALRPGGRILDIGCGYGRHAIELVQRGLDVTGLDLSLSLLIRAADEAQKRAMSVNFVHADMREMAFEEQFDGAYCMLTSFGYFDEEANLRVAEGIARALKPGARFLLDIVNRDYIVGDLPSRVWWEGNGCVVLEEVDFNFHTSRILTHRSIVFEDGRQLEQEISVRAYGLHEIGRLLRQAGFRVLEISGSLATRGHFFGGTSRNLLILTEKRADETP
jgi:SAM-dependent methyltransferase